MLDFLESNSHVRYVLARIWPDYHPESAGASPGGRSLMVEHFDDRRLGSLFHQLRRPLETTMIMGGMTVARDDVPHFLRMTRSVRSAAYVAGLFARHVFDRLHYPHGTRIANGNALIGRLAMTLLEHKVPLWLSSPVTRLVVEDGAVVGAIVERDNIEVEVRARRAVVLASGGFPAAEELRTRYYGHVQAGKNHHPLPPATNTGDGIRIARDVGAKFTDDAAHPAAWTPVSLVPQANGKLEPFPHLIDRGNPASLRWTSAANGLSTGRIRITTSSRPWSRPARTMRRLKSSCWPTTGRFGATVLVQRRPHRVGWGHICAAGTLFALPGFSDCQLLAYECEMVFRMSRDLSLGDAPYERATVSAAIDAAYPAFEILDFRNIDFKAIDGWSSIVDNALIHDIVIGPEVSEWQALDIANLTGTLTVNGDTVASALTGEALGHPLDGLIWIANNLAARKRQIKAGQYLITGSVFASQLPKAGDSITYEIEEMGKVELVLT